jgi:rare lipoprotein A (peptidoglycan hydrolase)
VQSLLLKYAAFARVPASEWRLGVLILITALSLTSQGCGIISQAPGRAKSTRVVSSSRPEAAKLAIEEPQTHSPLPQIPVIAKVPSTFDATPTPVIAKVPLPPQSRVVEAGLASWYGPGFHGKLTASGEVFNQEKFTAAHRTLPWGSRVRVINLANGKAVVVQINDRGPAVKSRIIDVSRAAARALGMVEAGTATVQVELLSGSEKSNELASDQR